MPSGRTAAVRERARAVVVPAAERQSEFRHLARPVSRTGRNAPGRRGTFCSQQHQLHGLRHRRRAGEIDLEILRGGRRRSRASHRGSGRGGRARHLADRPAAARRRPDSGGARRSPASSRSIASPQMSRARASAIEEVDAAAGERRAVRRGAGDRDHRRQAGAAGQAEDVARRVLAQIGHAVGPIDGEGLADRHLVEEIGRCRRRPARA